MYVYYIFFVFLLMLSIGNRSTLPMRYVLAGCLLFGLAAIRGEAVDNDYQGYLELYSAAVLGAFWNIEPSFLLLTSAVQKLFDNPLWLFVIYAALGISIKMVAFEKLSQHKMTTLVVYFSGFFLLWEMTQIRVAVAGGFMLLSVVALRNRETFWYFLLCSLASFFHYAALIMFFLYFINGAHINRWAYCLLLPAASLLTFSDVKILDYAAFAPIELIELKIESYETYKDPSTNVFNYVFLSRCVLAYFLLAHANLLATKNRYFVTLLKLYFLGLFIHLVLASGTGVAFRLSELLLVVEVLLIPMLVDVFKTKALGYSCAIATSFVFLAFSLHYTKLLSPYYVNPAFL